MTPAELKTAASLLRSLIHSANTHELREPSRSELFHTIREAHHIADKLEVASRSPAAVEPAQDAQCNAALELLKRVQAHYIQVPHSLHCEIAAFLNGADSRTPAAGEPSKIFRGAV